MSAFPSILFRADDAGGARAANLAIAEAVTRGPVRNVSVMACGPELAHAASVFGPLAAAGRIALGLHATINAEWAEVKWGPVAPADEVGSLLRGDGAFMSSPLVLHERGFVVAEVLHEVAAQLGCLRAVGLAPVYLDTHMGFDWLPGVREGLAALARREGLVMDMEATHPRLPAGRGLAQRVRGAGPGLRVAITHPGRRGVEMDAFWHEGLAPGRVAAEREAEAAELVGEELAAALRETGAGLARYA